MTGSRPGALAESNHVEARRWRVYLVAAMIAGFSAVLMARLVYLQVVENARFRAMATDEHWRRTVLPPRRGDIVDTNGNPLATSVTYQTLYASTSEIENSDHVANVLAPMLGQSQAALRARLSQKQSAPILIQRWLPDDVASKIEGLRIAGLFLQYEPRRAYPQGDLAAQVLGVVGIDNNGLSGLELTFDQDVAGKPGALVAERDTAGDAIPYGPRDYTAPENGATLTLTIDRYVQWVAERELDAAIQRHGAKGGSVVVIDPRTGAILAMAGRPTFHHDDPNLFSPDSIAKFGIPAVSGAYEPDSTFEIVTMAAALDAGTVAPDTAFLDSGIFSYFGGTVHDPIARLPGPETMTQSLIYGSSVGASWAATRLGAPAFYEYAERFGFGRSTQIELPGEATGELRLSTAPNWVPFDLATNSFGQGLAITPLQMAVAVGAIANRGILLKPYVVKNVAGPGVSRAYYPTVKGQVIHPETAANLTRMLVAVVDDQTAGVARSARVPGYQVAGMPGTVGIPKPDNDSLGSSLATFVGFAPAESPRFVIFVRVDESKNLDSSGDVAAPIFGAIVRQLLQYYQIPPSRPVSGIGT